MHAQKPRLVFVYNADSGLFNAMADAAHKVFSPDTYACNLCKVTYGWMTEKRAWRAFVEQLPMPVGFLHRDELRRDFPALFIALPAVLRRDGAARGLRFDAEGLTIPYPQRDVHVFKDAAAND